MQLTLAKYKNYNLKHIYQHETKFRKVEEGGGG